MGTEGDVNDANDLQYIKYSAKEILFHLTSKVEQMQAEVSNIQRTMVTRDELSSTRRWAFTAVMASLTAIGTMIGLLA